LGMDRSNIGREVDGNKDTDGVYRGGHAHKRAMSRRKKAKQKYRKIENDPKLKRYVTQKMKLRWSPEQIAGRLKRVRGVTMVCHETIYTFIYEKRPELVKYLRHQRNKYRKKRGTHTRLKMNRISKVRMISERPSIVEERSRVGDWEGDTVVGKEKKQRILTYVERKSGYGIGSKLDVVTAEIVERKTETIFKKISTEKRLTLTRDNGPEFGDYDRMLEKNTGMDVYRANPYHSWERGSNENWNGLLRQFFPKGLIFATIAEYDVQHAVRMLNNRPRKRLGFQTPREEFNKCCISD